MAKIIIDKPIKGYVTYYCQGCDDVVTIPVSNHAMTWEFNGDVEHPTLSPSIRQRGGKAGDTICHHFIKDGHIQFLSDCTHHLAGKTLWMEEIPKRYDRQEKTDQNPVGLK